MSYKNFYKKRFLIQVFQEAKLFERNMSDCLKYSQELNEVLNKNFKNRSVNIKNVCNSKLYIFHLHAFDFGCRDMRMKLNEKIDRGKQKCVIARRGPGKFINLSSGKEDPTNVIALSKLLHH